LELLADTLTNKQTDRQTNKNQQKHYLLGIGNNFTRYISTACILLK